MYEITFYIFAALTIASAIYIAFSKTLANNYLLFIIILFSVQGLLVLLNLHFLAIISILFILSKISLLVNLSPQFKSLTKGEDVILPVPFLSISVISVLTALIASLISSAKWQVFDVNYSINNYGDVFMKYSPLFILLGLLGSVFISSFGFILKQKKDS
jgi:NADH-quinone oxidoreductase subunit J